MKNSKNFLKVFALLIALTLLALAARPTAAENRKEEFKRRTLKSGDTSKDPDGCGNLNLYPVVQKGLWGYINREGQVVIQPQFEGADYFCENLAAIKLGRRVGFIDPTGKIVINPVYDDAEQFHDGIASVRIKEKWGYIDKTGHYIWEPSN